MSTQLNAADPRFAPDAQAFLHCMTCDTSYPPGSERCSTCNGQLSSVRRCPHCQRLLSSKHEQCIYCAASFLAIHQAENTEVPIVPIKPTTYHGSHKQRRAALFGICIFIATFLAGMLLMHLRQRNAQAPVLATTYTIRATGLKLQPSSFAATVATVPSGTVLGIQSSAIDDQGHRWFEVVQSSRNVFVSISDVSPPKADQREGGEKILRFWLVGSTDPTQSTETVQAVHFFCNKYNVDSTCEELKWVAADRMRVLAEGSKERHALNSRARELYESIVSSKGQRAPEAAKALIEMQRSPQNTGAQIRQSGVAESTGTEASRQYSLINRAEVHVKIQDLRTTPVGTTFTAPIAREVIINRQTAIPQNATCYLTVLSVDSASGKALIKLNAIEMRGKRYNIGAQPRYVTNSGALVIFQLDAPLLIGH